MEVTDAVRPLLEHQVNEDPSLLARAWDAREPFVLLPDRAGVSPGWVETSLSLVPEPLRAGHFAMLTSGSTGKPKLIIGSMARAEALARTLHRLQESEPVRRAVLTLPLTYTYSFVNQWLWSHVHGRELVRTAGLGDPGALGRTLEGAEEAMLCLVGVQVPLLTKYFGGRSFGGVIRVHFAGGRFPQERLEELGRLFPSARVFNNYGCAEAMPRLTIRRAEEGDEAGNIGRTLPGVEMRADGDDALVFRSPFGAVGVVEEGAGFRPIDAETWVPTGDLGRLGEDGMWRLMGRASEVFKRYGEKISLPMLTGTVLGAWAGQAAFYRETDARGEEGHVLVVSPSPSEAEVRTVLRALAAKHPRTHWPLRVESMERLPTLPSGKVDTSALRQSPDRREHWRQRI